VTCSRAQSDAATHRNTPLRTATHCNTLQRNNRPQRVRHAIELRATLQHTATHRHALQHTATHCTALQHNSQTLRVQHAVELRVTLQHTAAHSQSLQHTATHCNTLQHTATQQPNIEGATRNRAESAALAAILKEASLFIPLLYLWYVAVCCSVLQCVAV